MSMKGTGDGYSVWQLFGSPGERSSQSGLRTLVAEGRADQAYVPWSLSDDGTMEISGSTNARLAPPSWSR